MNYPKIGLIFIRGKKYFIFTALNSVQLVIFLFFRKHMRVHNKDREKKYKCNLCDNTFYTKDGYTRHMMVHSGDLPFPCDVRTSN